MGIIRKFLGLGLAAFIGLSATGAKVDPAYCNQNDIIGDTPIMTNAEKWVSNLLGDGKYDPSTDEGRTELARDVIKAFGAEDTSVKGRLAFRLTGIKKDTTITVAGITANGNFTIDWGDGTREVVENPPLLAGAMPRAPKSVSHKFPGDIPAPVIDFPEGDIVEIRGDGNEDTGVVKTAFIYDEDGNCPIEAANMSDYDKPIVWEMGAFARASGLKKITIGTNVVSIGIACFSMCPQLEEVVINCRAINGWGAFQGCHKLKKVTFGKECVFVAQRTFLGDDALESVIFEDGSKMHTIQYDAFSGCGSLKKLDLPDGIRNFELGYLSGVTDLRLPDSIETLGVIHLADAGEKHQFVLPPNVKAINGTFAGWTNLEYVTIPRTCKKIGGDTFYCCLNLTNIEFEAGCRLTYVLGGDATEQPYSDCGAFYRCESLREIKLPFGAGEETGGVRIPSIGANAFNGCTTLEKVTLDYLHEASDCYIGGPIFRECPNVRSIVMTSDYAPAAYSLNIFGTLPTGCKISVPNGSGYNYRRCDGWGDYAGFIEERSADNAIVVVRSKVNGAASASIRLGPTYCGDTFIVDWGDGYRDEYESGASPMHKYALPYYAGKPGYLPDEFVVRVYGGIKRIEGCRDGTGESKHTYLANAASDNADRVISYVYVNADDSNIRIGDYCFKGCSLTEFAPGQYVTKIGNNCFQNSTSLANVEFNSRGWLDSIGNYSFAGCPMTSISLPKSLYDIGAYAFYGCKNLKDVSYEKNGNIETIGNYAFTGNKIGTYTELACILENIEIPDTVKRIGNGAFDGCWYAKTISLPRDGVLEEIGDRAFYNALELTGEISIPRSVRKVGANAFYSARAITGINLPQDGHLEYIGDKAFYYVTNHLDDITIPATVKWIGDQSFGGYSFQPNITFAEGSRLEHIGFLGDQAKLGAVEFPSTLKYFGGYYSWKVDGEIYTPTLPNGVEYIGSLGVNDHPTATEYTLPQSAKYLHMTLDGWSSLESVTVPAGVTNMYSAFSWCSELKNVTFENGCPGLKEIGRDSFNYCRKLQSIVIPDNVEVVGYEAFAGCDELASVTLPANLRETGYCAFWNCPKITAITIPDGMVKIGDSSFARTSLTEVSIPASVTEIDEDAFANIETLTTVRIYSATPPTCKDHYGSASTTPLGATIPSNCRIYVPSASRYTYMYDSVWGTYRNKIYGM